MKSKRAFSDLLLTWFDHHGRKDLPWQRRPSAYRVWVSEIMLQQTQVKTVIPYYERFMKRFPRVTALAQSPLDDVLHLWSGLGYYARARNLHETARRVCERHGGRFPADIETLRSLPGIGRSTAGAILALSKGERHPILDGNVKRVLTRYHGVDGWPGNAKTTRSLWALADEHTPRQRVAEYTQAIMDLGATVCTRTRPNCPHCPVRESCVAHRDGRQAELPARRQRPSTPVRDTVFVILRDSDGRVLLDRRPPAGVWGGLWSFPECPSVDAVPTWCHQRTGRYPRDIHCLESLRHTFTHFKLDIQPVLVHLEPEGAPLAVREVARERWCDPGSPPDVGLAAPVSKLLGTLRSLVW